MKTCENCGSKVFSVGCVNCDEDNYIEIQRHENNEIKIITDNSTDEERSNEIKELGNAYRRIKKNENSNITKNS
jgi:hypothetical protein